MCVRSLHQDEMAARHFTADELIHFIIDIPGDGVESNDENMFGGEGNTEFDLADVNRSDSDSPEESVEEVNEPSTLRCGGGGGLGLGKKVMW